MLKNQIHIEGNLFSQNQKNTNNYRLISIIQLCVSTLLFTLVFSSNPWSSVREKWFTEWRMTIDAPIVGRLTQSRETGLLSYAGLLGYGDDSNFSDDSELVRHQYETYLSGDKFQEFTTYNSAIGFQGMLLGIFEKYSIFSPRINWRIFLLSTAGLSGIALSLVSLWVYCEFGLIAALFSTGFMLFSEWLTLFGGSIYWSLWAIYIPLIVALNLFINSQKDYYSWKRAIILIFFSILIKCLFNGFEYITVVIVMSYIPLVYYGLVYTWNKKIITKATMSTLIAQVMAVFTALGILLYQNSVMLGGVKNALEFIVYSLEKRSIGNPNNFSASISESLQANLGAVLKSYITGRSNILNINGISFVATNFNFIHDIKIKYVHIFAIFLLFTLIFIAFRKYFNGSISQRKLNSFIFATWLSLLAPLSWLIFFKAHSYLHLHMNFIVWQMPFTIFGFGMCGAIIQSFFESRIQQYKSSHDLIRSKVKDGRGQICSNGGVKKRLE